MWKIFIANLLTMLTPLTFLVFNSESTVTPLVVSSSVSLSGLIAIIGAKLIAKPWQSAAQNAKTIFSNPITQHIYTGRNDELGTLNLVIKAQQSQIATIIHRISSAATNLDRVATHTESIITKSEESLQKQHLEIDQVATAMNQMSATVHEVAQNAAQSADATTVADADVKKSKLVVTEAINGINQLAQQISEASSTIDQLAGNTEAIGTVVDVIRGIAEQTTLLALSSASRRTRQGLCCCCR